MGAITEIELIVSHIVSKKIKTTIYDNMYDLDIIKELGGINLDVVEILMEIEVAFDIKIRDTDTNNLKTINQMIEYVAKFIDDKN